VDASTSNYTITGYNGIAHSNAQTQGGHTTSIAFVGASAQYLSVPSSSDWNMVNDDYAIQMWIWVSGSGGYQNIFYRWDGIRCFQAFLDPDRIIHFFDGTNELDSGILSANTWHFIEMGRSSYYQTMWVDGSEYTGSSTSTPACTTPLQFGAGNSGESPFNGYLDDIEVYHGIFPTPLPTPTPTATPTVTPTPTATPTPDPVVFLLHSNTTNGSEVFTDSSNSAHGIVGYGSIAHSNAQTQGGHTTSIAFTGSGQYLSVDSHTDWDFGSGDYTIKFSLYLVSHADVETIIARLDSNSLRCFSVYLGTDDKLNFLVLPNGTWDGLVNLVSTSGLTLNTWHNIIVGRNGANMIMTIDGSTISTAAANVFTPGSGVPITIGRSLDGTALLYGYLDEIEIVKGVWQP
jgi:hypothetical protein